MSNLAVLLLPYWIFVSLLVIVATFIDFDHFIIPDEITLGSAAVGRVARVWPCPQLMGEESHALRRCYGRCSSAAVGYGLTLCGRGRRRANWRLAGSASCSRRRKTSSGGAARTKHDAALVIGARDVTPGASIFNPDRKRDEARACIAIPTRARRTKNTRGAVLRLLTTTVVELDGTTTTTLDELETFSGQAAGICFPARGDGFWRREVYRGHRCVPGLEVRCSSPIAAASMIGSVVGHRPCCCERAEGTLAEASLRALPVGWARWCGCLPDRRW